MKKYFNNREVNDFSDKIHENMDITISITGDWIISSVLSLYEENHEIVIDCKVDDYDDFSEILKSYTKEFAEIYSISVITNK